MKHRITFKSNKSGESKTVVIGASECTLEHLLSIASKKLKVKARVLVLNGTELTGESINHLEDGVEILVLSNLRSSATKHTLHTATSVATESSGDGVPSQSLPILDPAKHTVIVNDGDEAICTSHEDDSRDPGVSADNSRKNNITVIANRSIVESGAVDQLKQALVRFPCIKVAAGMPDLHPGPQFPIGAAFGVDGHVMPFLVGNDVGCGMTLFPTQLKDVGPKKSKKWADSLTNMEGAWEGDVQDILANAGVSPTQFDADSLGTVGGGNHFAELQAIERVEDEDMFRKLKMDQNRLYLLIHSGSRGYGNWILKQHLENYGTEPLVEGTEAFQSYITQHDNACAWAKCNRKLIAHRFLTALGADTSVLEWQVMDICHNNVVLAKKFLENGKRLWLHRKGAAPANCGPVVIPGSRGAYSYLVLPTNTPDHKVGCYSLPHGAGRRWTRGKALNMGRSRFHNPQELSETALHGHVVCDDTTLLYQEQPDAYKDISDIIEDLKERRLISIVAVLRPVITFKKRGQERAQQPERWKEARKQASKIDEWRD